MFTLSKAGLDVCSPFQKWIGCRVTFKCDGRLGNGCMLTLLKVVLDVCSHFQN